MISSLRLFATLRTRHQENSIVWCWLHRYISHWKKYVVMNKSAAVSDHELPLATLWRKVWELSSVWVSTIATALASVLVSTFQQHTLLYNLKVGAVYIFNVLITGLSKAILSWGRTGKCGGIPLTILVWIRWSPSMKSGINMKLVANLDQFDNSKLRKKIKWYFPFLLFHLISPDFMMKTVQNRSIHENVVYCFWLILS